MRRVLIAVLVLAIALLVSSCGNSKKSSTKELPRTEFAQKGDAICKATDKKIAAAAPQFNPATATKAQIKGAAKGLQIAATGVRDQVAKVAALGEPKEAAPKKAWAELHSLLVNKSDPNLQQVATDARAGNVSAFKADFQKLSSQDAAQTKLVKVIGFKVCGVG